MKINLPFNENILPKRFGKEAEPGDVIKNNPVVARRNKVCSYYINRL